MAKLYVISGSDACRTTMLALDLKGVGFRTVVLPTGLHPFLARLHGFPGSPEPIRSVEGRAHAGLAAMDRMGTVPALDYEGRLIQTNRKILPFLDQLRPQPPLYPADPGLRAAAEEAVRWGDETLQMAARRIVMAAAGLSLDALHERGAGGRLGPLLARRDTTRLLLNAFASRTTFKAGTGRSAELRATLPPMLDRIDGWIADGTLNGEQLGAADLTIAPSLALLDYRLDLREELRARPSFALLERTLPEPVPV
jgi:glutathione S-transferase